MHDMLPFLRVYFRHDPTFDRYKQIGEIVIYIDHETAMQARHDGALVEAGLVGIKPHLHARYLCRPHDEHVW